MEGGADIRYIQAMLGHADLSTTQIYTQVSIRALQAVHAATHPGASNTRHRSPTDLDPDVVGDVPDGFSTDPVCPDHDDLAGPDGDVMTDHHEHDVTAVEVLFSVLEQEIDQENRADPGSPEAILPPRRPSRRSS